MNLTRTREQGQTVVPTCIEPLSWWNESFESPTVSSITGDSVKRIVYCVCALCFFLAFVSKTNLGFCKIVGLCWPF
ncbi:hypothetical protein HanXRQr2_Chr17g0810671 [Helianthus annuus]|uniref:Uncharacterized protein n=1 Tax=Helianthus annuus TaxID=4232 RepID=A0A9K3GUD4_HELAN|nr:hypothetical protein HanXRQr2_Chr17g0810671 [Helianthus annuus]KAJ0813808.1 hypothetical protein HanPSC8_Chr17g0777971 [Helianthus annuus]